MDSKTWTDTLGNLNDMSEDEFNEILRFALSARAERDGGRLDWSTGFAVEQVVGSTTYIVEQ
jgi:predicted Ser/Thr protein kinase